tara:strand:+ start:75 stop:320 length:246 start_codon:yes stop_codon:yes gene_type:complete
MLDGAQVTEIAAVGVGFCAAAGAATASIENIYKAKRNEARFTVDTNSPIMYPSSVTLITILGIWPDFKAKNTIHFGGPEGI